MQILGRQGLHRVAGDVGRVADDQVEALPLECTEQIGFDQLDTAVEAIIGDVLGGDVERVRRQVGGGDPGVGKGVGHQHGETARAGAQVECRRQFVGLRDPGLHPLFEQAPEE